ncbi:uncharacterized protein LOC132267041 isoform X2 [Cornus florida]|uniref:uncharacterized protein LOC132267041 isoform X2 n=1 Tax=Cornus florida TaxID=4283 RepID=UPI00289CFA1A|nr:uncharacterized protein LOC132267041 isoform X2 [Cornus florida]
MNISLECTEQKRCREASLSSSFHCTVYSEIEEVGWEHLVRLSQDLKFLSFRILDKTGRVHIMEILLDKSYPKCPPSISADVPHIFNLEWSINSRLKDVVQQFQEHLENLQEFWSTVDDIDQSLWVVDPKQLDRAASYRQINIGNECFLMLFIDANDPKSLPDHWIITSCRYRFMGADPEVNSLRKLWKRNCRKWYVLTLTFQKLPTMELEPLTSPLRKKNKPVPENLAIIMETQLPGPPDVQKNNQQVECGICYAQCLPIDDELGARSGSGTDYTCDNNNCKRAFHSLCLGDWLRSITSTRQSFDVMFGNCPYCSEPVAVKINSKK